MKMIFLIIAYLFACAGPVISQGTNNAANNAPTNILFSVKAQDKSIIPTLRKEDIRVFEDGIQQGVLSFQKESDVPLSIALMVDASASQERIFTRLKTAALLLFGSVTQPGKDMVAVISFTGKPTLDQSLTTDLQQVRKVIEQLKPVQLPADFLEQVKRKQPKVGSDLADMGSTAIWDAVSFTAEEVLAKAPDEKKRVIILITDGVDSSSRKKLSEAIDQATKAKVVIYSIGIGDDKLDLLDKTSLIRVSEQAGGRAFFPKSPEQLNIALAEIEQELREHYVLTFFPLSSKPKDSYCKIKIEIVNSTLRRQNWRLLYQERYFSAVK